LADVLVGRSNQIHFRSGAFKANPDTGRGLLLAQLGQPLPEGFARGGNHRVSAF